MYMFWVIVIAIGLINRVLLSLTQRMNPKRMHSESVPLGVAEGNTSLSTRNSRLRNVGVWLKAHLIIPAAFGYKKSQSFGWYTVPPRIESLTILAFIILNIFCTIHGYHIFPNNL